MTSEQARNIAPNFNHTFLRRATVAVVACLAVTSCTNSPDQAEPPTDVPSHTQEAAPVTTPTLTEKCPAVPAKAVRATTKLLDHPHDFAHYIKKSPLGGAEDDLWQKRKVAAARNGLTVYDYRTEYDYLSADAYSLHGPKIPLSKYLAAAQEFSTRYGVQLSIPQKVPENSYGLQMSPIDLTSLNHAQQQALRTELLSYIADIGELPVEFVKSAGLEHVYIAKIHSKNITGLADPIAGGNFYVDGLKDDDSTTFTHELTHLWDAHVCGGSSAMFNDPGLDKLNPAKIYREYPTANVKTKREGYKDYDSVLMSGRAAALLKKASEASIMGDKKKSKAADAAYDKIFAKVVVMDDHGFKNVGEDKATLGQVIFSPYDYQTIYSKIQPYLAEKFAYVLARLYSVKPKIARYFIEVGNNTFS